MRIKIAIILFFFALFLIIAQRAVFAQGIIPGDLQVGLTCGKPGGAGDTQKCCKSTIITPGAIKYDLGHPVLNGAYDLIYPIIGKNTNPIIQKQKSLQAMPCFAGSPSKPGDINNPDCICISDPTPAPLPALTVMCETIKDASERATCKICAKYGGLWTALGCFSGNMSEFIANNVMRTGIGIAGGVSMLCIMLAAFQMQTSSGNAEKIKKAQELLTNCITGLMVIIFSILILKIIGVDILRIPGFN